MIIGSDRFDGCCYAFFIFFCLLCVIKKLYFVCIVMCVMVLCDNLRRLPVNGSYQEVLWMDFEA